jgi:cold shock CspA family protein
MKEGITTHFLPLSSYGEKGIDVWLSLEAYELSVMKHFNVVVLVVCDGDYLSLVRKINGLGTKVMVLGWDFEYTDAYGRMGRTVTSARLLNEATYPILMHTIIDDKTKYHDPLINNLFVSPENSNEYENSSGSKDEYGGSGIFDDDSQEGIVIALKDGYGFIQCDTRAENIFFYWGDVEDEFNDLEIGDKVSFHFGTNERGICAKHVERIDSL